MGLAHQVFKVREQRPGNPLASGSWDHGQPLYRQMIGGVLQSNRTDRRVADPGQHGPTLIEGALHIGYALTINPRWRVQHPTVLGIRGLSDAVDTRGVFACGLGEAHMICSHFPLDHCLTAIRPAVEANQLECTPLAHLSAMIAPSLFMRLARCGYDHPLRPRIVWPIDTLSVGHRHASTANRPLRQAAVRVAHAVDRSRPRRVLVVKTMVHHWAYLSP
jgi:hypothetical protein